MRPLANTLLICIAFSGCVIASRVNASLRGLATCSPESVIVDTSQATTSGDIIWGKAWGETFTAADTLIQSVTVWRIPPEHNDSTSTKFWITEVDSGGTPHTHLVVYEGPWLMVVSPDSTRPTPIT